MAIPLKEIKGMSEAAAAALSAKGYTNSEKLLVAGKTPAGRKELAGIAGVDPKEVTEWINRCDLERVKGVAGVYADLLETAGVDTVKELSKRRADNLHAKIIEVNTAQKLTTRPPTAAQVEAWVAEAKTLPAGVEY